jgi:glyoxylase-like metal-dependent hydrolase (beta-lactamase superfamily II)
MSTGLRLADRWFERRAIGDGITFLTEPHVHRLLRCNIWHVRGRDRDLLVDTGLGVTPLRDEIRDLLDHDLIAVATHVHYDHVGGLHEFEDARIHRLELEQMADYREFQCLRRDEFPPDILAELAELDMAVDDELLITAVPSADFDVSAYRVRSARAQALEDGQVLDLGDRHFQVLHLPGHSPGSIGLWDAASETLFSGDAVYDGPLLDNLPESDITAYVSTMKRLRELPVRVVHGGHEPSFGRERLVELVDAYLELRA